MIKGGTDLVVDGRSGGVGPVTTRLARERPSNQAPPPPAPAPAPPGTMVVETSSFCFDLPWWVMISLLRLCLRGTGGRFSLSHLVACASAMVAGPRFRPDDVSQHPTVATAGWRTEGIRLDDVKDASVPRSRTGRFVLALLSLSLFTLSHLGHVVGSAHPDDEFENANNVVVACGNHHRIKHHHHHHNNQ